MYPLEKWAIEVGPIPAALLPIEDLARCVRQRFRLPDVLDLVLERLEEDPWAGELYPGELAASLGHLDHADWRPDQALRFLERAASFGQRPDELDTTIGSQVMTEIVSGLRLARATVHGYHLALARPSCRVIGA